MKLYRYIKGNERSKYLISRGYENEGYNLIKEGFISPSFMYNDFISGRKDRLANSFALEKEMTKYFFLSLKDAIAWASYCFLRDVKNYGLYYEYAILEIDIAEDIVKKYLGVGFYDEIKRLESRLPYKVLVDALNGQENPTLLQALKLYNSSYKKMIFPWNKELRQFFRENKNYKINYDLKYFGTNWLYPYLCFPLTKTYGILNPFPEQKNYAWPCIISNELNKVLKDSQINPKLILLPEIVKSSISEENDEVKLLLKKEGYNFEVRKGK